MPDTVKHHEKLLYRGSLARVDGGGEGMRER